jgi:hypothetical protein
MYARNLVNECKFIINLTQYLFTIYISVKLRKCKCVRLNKAADQRKKQERKKYLKVSLHSNRTGADEFGFSTLILLNQ